MAIQLSDHFSYKKLLRFTLPSIIMMIFTSVYGVVDGFFVSNFVGKTPFAAVNFIMPFLMILGAIGFMFGTGGGALIAITLGEGDRARAQRLFSLFVYVSAACAVVIAVLGILFLRPIASLLGAEGQMLEDCVTYGRIILIALPAYILQFEFQSFFITAEKPQIGLWVTVAAGVTNMVLDALFIAVILRTVMIPHDGRASRGVADKHSEKDHIDIHQHAVRRHTILARIFHQLHVIQHSHKRHGDVGHQLRRTVDAGTKQGATVKAGFRQPQKTIIGSCEIEQRNDAAHRLT